MGKVKNKNRSLPWLVFTRHIAMKNKRKCAIGRGRRNDAVDDNDGHDFDVNDALVGCRSSNAMIQEQL